MRGTITSFFGLLSPTIACTLLLVALLPVAQSSAQTGNYDNVNITNDLNFDMGTHGVGTLNKQAINFDFYDPFETTQDQTFGVLVRSENNGAFGGGIGFSNNTAESPFWVFDQTKSGSLTAGPNGVGIGTFFPKSTLHVLGSSSDTFGFGLAKVTVENNVDTPKIRTMFELINNGGSRFRFVDTNLDSSWVFSSNQAGDFSISLNGTGGSEIKVQQDGRVVMGPGGVPNFSLETNGDLNIEGTLNQNSDRNLKTDIKAVTTSDVLAKLDSIPITTWKYKKDQQNVTHMGPMSQDFHAAFGLGASDKKISVVDGIGVSLAAIKGLGEKLRAKDQHIASLQETVERQTKDLKNQREELEQQRELLQELSLRLESLESKE